MREHDEPGASTGRPWVCVVNPYPIGDTLVMVPMLRALRDRYPGAQLHLVTPSPTAPVLRAAAEVDVYRPDHRLRLKPPPLGRKPPEGMHEADLPAYEASLWPQEVERWQTLGRPVHIAAMITTVDPEWEQAERTYYLGVPLTYYVGWPDGGHIARLARDTVAEGPWDPTAYRLTLPRVTPRPIRRHKTVYLIPGGSLGIKRWPADQFRRLAEHLTAQGYNVVVVVGEADSWILVHMGWEGPALIGANLLDLARRFAHAPLVVGNDTGITHLASLMGAPTLALFGPAEPEEWHPLGPHVAVVRAESPGDGEFEQLRFLLLPMDHLELASVVTSTDALLARTSKELNHAA